MQSHLINFSVSAFPDLRPWQVRKACLVDEQNPENDVELDILAEFYYTYLSQLLHPSHGHDHARSDERLVKVNYSCFPFVLLSFSVLQHLDDLQCLPGMV